MSREVSKKEFWRIIYDELKPYEVEFNNASCIATSLYNWYESRNYYYIIEARQRLERFDIKRTKYVTAILQEADTLFLQGRTNGDVDQPRKLIIKDEMFLRMAKILYTPLSNSEASKRKRRMSIDEASGYASVMCKAIYKGSTLAKEYSSSMVRTGREASYYEYLDQHELDHYERWTKIIDQLKVESENLGTRR